MVSPLKIFIQNVLYLHNVLCVLSLSLLVPICYEVICVSVVNYKKYLINSYKPNTGSYSSYNILNIVMVALLEYSPG